MRGSNVVNNTVQGNFIGTDATGMNALPNIVAGVTIDTGSSSNLIGGTVAGARNVISGNNSYFDYGVIVGGSRHERQCGRGKLHRPRLERGDGGLKLFRHGLLRRRHRQYVRRHQSPARAMSFLETLVTACWLKTPARAATWSREIMSASTRAAMTAVPNYFGVICYNGATNNLIGGTSAGAANYVSGNYYGVCITDPGTSGNFVEGNFIGTDHTGTNGVGNYDNVVLQNSATGNFIGGVSAGAGNVIAFAGWAGVILYNPGTTNNSIRGNSIFNNPYLGLHLVGASDSYPYVTTNDIGDADTGPNNLQNFPVITNAFGYAAGTIVSGDIEQLHQSQFSH